LAPLDLRHKPLLAAIASAALSTSTDQFSAQELTNTLWAFAALKFCHEPLLQALSSQAIARISQVTTQNLVNSAWALDVLGCRDLNPNTVDLVLARFVDTCEKSLAVEWVTLAAVAEKHGSVADDHAFRVGLRARILEPALAHLRALRSGGGGRARDEAFQRLQQWVVDVQLPHFGAAHTRDALLAAGAGSGAPGDREWVRRARGAVSSAASWSCPHAAVSSQGVIAWLAARLEVGGVAVEEPGRVLFADDSAEHSILVERMLKPLFLQVPRNGHAERRGLVDLVRSVARALGHGGAEHWEGVRGSVELYASHYPCISCLAAVAQFKGLLPGADLEVEFDDAWATWTERPPR